MIEQNISDFYKKSIDYLALPHLSIGILYSDLADQSNGPMLIGSTDRIFKIGSLTKFFTCICILILESKGQLSIKDQVKQYLSWLSDAYEDSEANPIKIEDLLLHTSGMYRGKSWNKNPSEEEVKKFILKITSKSKINNQRTYKYSNLGFILLGLIIEKISGKPFQIFVQENLLKPLNMSQSGFSIDLSNEKLAEPNSLSYFDGIKESIYRLKSIPIYGAPHAAMDMHASMSDLFKLISCLFNNGISQGKKIIEQSIVKKLFNENSKINTILSSYFGMVGMKTMYGTIYYQDAEHWGHSSSLFLLPEKKMAICALCNRGSAGQDMSFITKSIYNYLILENDKRYLSYSYYGHLQIGGKFKDNLGNKIAILDMGQQQLIKVNNENPSFLAYKGNDFFIKLSGTYKNYPIQLIHSNNQVEGLQIGPYFFQSDIDPIQIAVEPKYKLITGIYASPTGGRLAIFESRGNLKIAYSPFKQNELIQISDTTFLNQGGPYTSEIISLDLENVAIVMNEKQFKKTAISY